VRRHFCAARIEKSNVDASAASRRVPQRHKEREDQNRQLEIVPTPIYGVNTDVTKRAAEPPAKWGEILKRLKIDQRI